MEIKEMTKQLSSLGRLKHPDIKLEQYQTDPKAATEFLNFVRSRCDIEGSRATDLGCGNGVLGIGLLLYGARKVDFYDIDKGALDVCRRNLSSIGLQGYSVSNQDIFDINGVRYDLVVSNPPFGIQSGMDIDALLNKVDELSSNIFLILKKNRQTELIAEKHSLIIGQAIRIKIGSSAKFHKKPSAWVDSYIVYKLADSAHKSAFQRVSL